MENTPKKDEAPKAAAIKTFWDYALEFLAWAALALGPLEALYSVLDQTVVFVVPAWGMTLLGVALWTIRIVVPAIIDPIRRHNVGALVLAAIGGLAAVLSAVAGVQTTVDQNSAAIKVTEGILQQVQALPSGDVFETRDPVAPVDVLVPAEVPEPSDPGPVLVLGLILPIGTLARVRAFLRRTRRSTVLLALVLVSLVAVFGCTPGVLVRPTDAQVKDASLDCGAVLVTEGAECLRPCLKTSPAATCANVCGERLLHTSFPACVQAYASMEGPEFTARVEKALAAVLALLDYLVPIPVTAPAGPGVTP